MTDYNAYNDVAKFWRRRGFFGLAAEGLSIKAWGHRVERESEKQGVKTERAFSRCCCEEDRAVGVSLHADLTRVTFACYIKVATCRHKTPRGFLFFTVVVRVVLYGARLQRSCP